jgi:hypothetical protein
VSMTTPPRPALHVAPLLIQQAAALLCLVKLRAGAGASYDDGRKKELALSIGARISACRSLLKEIEETTALPTTALEHHE